MESDTTATTPIGLCINLCETAQPDASAGQIEGTIARTCHEAGFPYCERIYVGSYFCENYFCGLSNAFHDAVRSICLQHELGATLVIPIIGQAFLERATRRISEIMERYNDVYDEIVVNDMASFLDLSPRMDKRIGLGRLFAKEQRDARIAQMISGAATPTFSAEAMECLASCKTRPLVEFDPIAAVVDVSEALEACPEAEITIHLPYCFATTGRNCGLASIDEPVDRKFVLGRGCSRHCLRMRQGYLTDGGVSYIKHGRTFYFENPGCSIAGARSWRIAYAASHETMEF